MRQTSWAVYDAEGTLHVDIAELCKALTWEPTAENCERASKKIGDYLRQHNPGIKILHHIPMSAFPAEVERIISELFRPPVN